MVYYLGIDIGGTKIKAVLLRGLRQQKVEVSVIDTPKQKTAFLRAINNLTRFNLVRLNRVRLSGIGIGVPGVVDRKRGIVVRAHNLPFLIGWDVKGFFEKYARNVRVDNDSRCMVRAEAAWGAARGYKNVVGLAIGTGIGGGIMIDGKMYYGKNNGAGEFGHTVLQIANHKSQIVTFEELAGKRAYEKWGDRSEIVGIGIANLFRSLDPDIVVLGGGGVYGGAVKLDTVRRVARQYLTVGKNTPIVKGKLGDAAGAVGAALLFVGESPRLKI